MPYFSRKELIEILNFNIDYAMPKKGVNVKDRAKNYIKIGTYD